jgi:Ca2+-binding RTX toxin-like protein
MKMRTILTATLVATGTSLVLALPTGAFGTVLAPSMAEATLCLGGAATIIGTPGPDQLVGTDGPDVIVGLGGDDEIDAGAGNDVLCGGDGQDLLRGDAGRDRLDGEGGDDELFAGTTEVVDGEFVADVLYGGGGDDLLDIGVETQNATGPSGVVTYTSSPAPVVIDLAAGTATGEGADTIITRPGIEVVGSAFADVIDGSDRIDWLYGYLGDDRVRGLGGNDTLILDSMDSDYVHGSNDDWADGGPGEDYIVGEDGSDTLRGGPDADYISSWGYRTDGSNQLFGDSGPDVLRVQLTGKPVVVDGGSGVDEVTMKSPYSLRRQQGRITITIRMVPRTIALGPRLVGQIRSIESVSVLHRIQLNYYGSYGADRVYAGKDARLRAWTLGGPDVIRGSRTSDFIDSGAGRDVVRAGAGRDTCLRAERRNGCELLR